MDRDRRDKPRNRSRSPKYKERASVKEELAEDAVKPNYKTSGLLAKESNKVNGVALKYVEPTDSCKPGQDTPKHRLFIFKGEDIKDTVELSSKAWYLLGRDGVCDITLQGASVSKQHAVIQFRRIVTKNKYGDRHCEIKCYLIDLDSSYGTKLNHDDIPGSRFVELRNKDMIQFGGIKDVEYVLIVS